MMTITFNKHYALFIIHLVASVILALSLVIGSVLNYLYVSSNLYRYREFETLSALDIYMGEAKGLIAWSVVIFLGVPLYLHARHIHTRRKQGFNDYTVTIGEQSNDEAFLYNSVGKSKKENSK